MWDLYSEMDNFVKKLGQIGHFSGLEPVAATLLQSFPNFRRQGSSSFEFYSF